MFGRPVMVVVLDPPVIPPRPPVAILPVGPKTNQSPVLVNVYADGILTVKLPAPSDVPDLRI